VRAIAHFAFVIVVNSLTLAHCQGLELGYMFVADFRYRLIRGSLFFSRFLAVGMGVGLYAGRLIREHIRYCSNVYRVRHFELGECVIILTRAAAGHLCCKLCIRDDEFLYLCV